MSEGLVLAGFREAAPLSFLPSYRRVLGELGLVEEPYSLAVERGAAVPLEALKSIFTTAISGAGSRTPSYTDRVLCASLSDLTAQLTCSEYTCNESLVLSDHRPVSASLSLSAWRQAERVAAGRSCSSSGRGGSSSSSSSSSSAGASRRHVRCRLHLYDLELRLESRADRLTGALRGPSSKMRDGRDTSQRCMEPQAAPTPAVVNMAFPMPAEDPAFALQRIAWLLGRASASANEHVPWPLAMAEGVTLTAELDLGATRSVHALVRFLDADNAKIGQGSIALPLPWHPSGEPLGDDPASHAAAATATAAATTAAAATASAAMPIDGAADSTSADGAGTSAGGRESTLFECQLTHLGQRVGSLHGRLTSHFVAAPSSFKGRGALSLPGQRRASDQMSVADQGRALQRPSTPTDSTNLRI